MKERIILCVVLGAVLAIGALGFAQYSVKNYSEPGGERWVVGGVISIGGAQNLKRVQVGTLNVVSGQTTGTATVAGVKEGDYVFAQLVTNASSAVTTSTAYIKSIAVTTNTITVTVNADPTTTQTVNYLWVATD